MNASDGSKSSPVFAGLVLILLAALVVGAGYLIYLGVRDAPSVVGALVTALGAVLAVVAGRIYETRTSVEQARRERMAPIYERLVQIFYSAAGERAPSESEMQEFFTELAERLLVWGPEPIIAAWVRWRAESAIHGDSPEALFAFERLIVAMRKDLGTKSSSLGRGDLLRVFVNDVDDYLGNGNPAADGS